MTIYVEGEKCPKLILRGMKEDVQNRCFYGCRYFQGKRNSHIRRDGDLRENSAAITSTDIRKTSTAY